MKRSTIIIALLVVLAGLGIALWVYNKARVDSATQAKDSGFMTSPEGIKYKIEKEGTGRRPVNNEPAEIHYTGWLDINGQEGRKFDSSLEKDKPLKFPMGMGFLIPGMERSVADMKEGEVRYIIIPPELGYGNQSIGPIPPNATLRFRIELLRIG